METNRITRGILIGGALGAFSAIFGISKSMFIGIGVGMIAGCFAGMTLNRLDKKRKNKNS